MYPNDSPQLTDVEYRKLVVLVCLGVHTRKPLRNLESYSRWGSITYDRQKKAFFWGDEYRDKVECSNTTLQLLAYGLGIVEKKPRFPWITT